MNPNPLNPNPLNPTPLNAPLLAIQGGPPTFPDGPPEWPVADESIIDSVNQALQSGQWGVYEGALTAQLHERLEAEFEMGYSLLCSSGTIGVELALRGVGVKPGDEVILSAYDFPGNFRAIEAIGAVPVLVDVVAGGWVMDPMQVAAAISDNTTAVIASHLHGQTVDVEAILEIVEPHRVKIVEDVCQSPGGRISAKPLGVRGAVATFSFGGSKLLSAGRGGAVLSHDESTIQRAKIFANRGNDAFPLSQIQAALLLPQIQQLKSRNRKRHAVAKKIADKVNSLTGLSSLELVQSGDNLGGFYKLPIMIDHASVLDRARFLATIQAEGVAIDAGFRGFTKRSTRRCRHVGALPHATLAAANTMLLHHPILLADDDQIDRLIDAMGRCHNFCLEQK